MSVAKGILVRPSTQAFRIEANFIDSTGTAVTSGTATAKVSEVQADGTLRAVDFSASPPTVGATSGTVPTTATIAMSNQSCGGVARPYWSATFSGTNLAVGGVYLVEFAPPGGATAASPKLLQFGSADGDLSVNSAGNVLDSRFALTGKVTAVTSTSSFTVTFDSTPSLNQAALIDGSLYLTFTSGLNQAHSSKVTGGTLTGAAAALTFTAAFGQTVAINDSCAIVAN